MSRGGALCAGIEAGDHYNAIEDPIRLADLEALDESPAVVGHAALEPLKPPHRIVDLDLAENGSGRGCDADKLVRAPCASPTVEPCA